MTPRTTTTAATTALARLAALSGAAAITVAMLFGTSGLAHASARTAALVVAQSAAQHA
jgi:hypothetical protein